MKGLSKAAPPGSLPLAALLSRPRDSQTRPLESSSLGHRREHASFGFLLHSLHNDMKSLCLPAREHTKFRQDSRKQNALSSLFLEISKLCSSGSIQLMGGGAGRWVVAVWS